MALRHQPEIREVSGIACRIEGEEVVRSKGGVCADQEVDQQPFRSLGRAAARSLAAAVSHEGASCFAPYSFLQVEIDCHVCGGQKTVDELAGGSGMRQQLDIDGRADDQTAVLVGAAKQSRRLGRAVRQFRGNADWFSFDEYLFSPRSPIYARRRSHLDVLKDPLYLALKDMWLQLGVQQGMIARHKEARPAPRRRLAVTARSRSTQRARPAGELPIAAGVAP